MSVELKFLGRFLLLFAALLLAAALVLGLSPGVFALLSLVSRWVELVWFVPGFALYVLGLCALGLVQWSRRASGQPSGPVRLPSAWWLGGGAVLAIALGQALLVTGSAPLFWPCFVLAAALPPLAALSLATQRLGGVTTWRRALAGLLSGSLLATQLAVLLGAAVSLLAYALVLPLRDLVAHVLASTSLEELFYSPALVFALVEVAVVAPLVEELAKPLGAMLLARRLRGPAEAFLVGMAGGVGFAILENMLYEAAGARIWAGVATLRAVGGVLHPLNAGLVAVGWYGVRHGVPGAWRRLLGLYGLAVGAHALWNGGLTVLLSATGTYFFGADTWRFDIYGLGQPGVVVTFMLLEALALWRLLVVTTDHLRDPRHAPVETTLALHLERPRRLVLWATGLLAVLVPAGALYGPLLARYADRLLPVR